MHPHHVYIDAYTEGYNAAPYGECPYQPIDDHLFDPWWQGFTDAMAGSPPRIRQE